MTEKRFVFDPSITHFQDTLTDQEYSEYNQEPRKLTEGRGKIPAPCCRKVALQGQVLKLRRTARRRCHGQKRPSHRCS